MLDDYLGQWKLWREWFTNSSIATLVQPYCFRHMKLILGSNWKTRLLLQIEQDGRWLMALNGWTWKWRWQAMARNIRGWEEMAASGSGSIEEGGSCLRTDRRWLHQGFHIKAWWKLTIMNQDLLLTIWRQATNEIEITFVKWKLDRSKRVGRREATWRWMRMQMAIKQKPEAKSFVLDQWKSAISLNWPIRNAKKSGKDQSEEKAIDWPMITFHLPGLTNENLAFPQLDQSENEACWQAKTKKGDHRTAGHNNFERFTSAKVSKTNTRVSCVFLERVASFFSFPKRSNISRTLILILAPTPLGRFAP